jgi:hypothetical protein
MPSSRTTAGAIALLVSPGGQRESVIKQPNRHPPTGASLEPHIDFPCPWQAPGWAGGYGWLR